MGRGAGRKPWPVGLDAAWDAYQAAVAAHRANPVKTPLAVVVEAGKAFDAAVVVAGRDR